MLLFIDEPKHIRLVRTNPEDGTREPLGRIKKVTLELADEVSAVLDDVEKIEVAAAIDLIRAGEVERVKAAVAAFPETVRTVLHYYSDSANDMERRWVLGALMEGLRVVRRLERSEAAAAA